MTHGSLFAGIGGFDLGFERAGFRTVWQVEIESFCNKILEWHFPKAKRYGDITKLDPAFLEKVDVITGGFPCQDLSVAGKRKGLSGERSGLFFELKRIIAGVRPAWIVVENVPGLFSSNRGRDFGLVLFHLAECGYGLAWRILDSRYFGVAQRRRRVFLVGRLGRACPPEILFESESVRGDSAKVGKAGRDSAKCLAGSSRIDYETEDFIIGSLQGGGKRGYRLGTEECRDGQIIFAPLKGHSPSQRNGGSRPIVDEFVVASESGPGFWKAGIGPLRAEGENRPSRPSTIIGAAVDSDGVREITGLSRRMDTPDGPRYRALGNAVTVNVAFWIAKRIMVYEKGALI